MRVLEHLLGGIAGCHVQRLLSVPQPKRTLRPCDPVDAGKLPLRRRTQLRAKLHRHLARQTKIARQLAILSPTEKWQPQGGAAAAEARVRRERRQQRADASAASALQQQRQQQRPPQKHQKAAA